MPKLTIVTRDGTETVVEGRVGWSVMENIRDNGFGLLFAPPQDSDFCACLRQPARHRPAEHTRSARDDGDLLVEAKKIDDNRL